MISLLGLRLFFSVLNIFFFELIFCINLSFSQGKVKKVMGRAMSKKIRCMEEAFGKKILKILKDRRKDNRLPLSKIISE